MATLTKPLEHVASSVEVFKSIDYNKFHMIKGNRNLDMNKIKRILSDIERGTNLLKYCPVLVVDNNGKLDIIDGQHRFVVSKKIKHPVFYIIAESLSLYDIARMNSNTEKWKIADFINCYKELGNTNYIRLEKFLKEYPGLSPTVAVSLLSEGKVLSGGYQGFMDKFHRGQFVIQQEEFAIIICNHAKAFNFDDKFSRAFLHAILKVVQGEVYDITELQLKVNENISLLQKQDHWRKYLTNMEEIVSKGKQKRLAIY